jgi:hypothetical protein
MKIKDYIAFHTEKESKFLLREDVITVKRASNGFYIVTINNSYISKYLINTDDKDIAEEFARR